MKYVAVCAVEAEGRRASWTYSRTVQTRRRQWCRLYPRDEVFNYPPSQIGTCISHQISLVHPSTNAKAPICRTYHVHTGTSVGVRDIKPRHSNLHTWGTKSETLVAMTPQRQWSTAFKPGFGRHRHQPYWGNHHDNMRDFSSVAGSSSVKGTR